jgi:hypothetical protein
MLTAFALTVSASCSSPAGNGDSGELLIEAHGPLIAGCTASLFVARAVKSPASSCKNPYGCNDSHYGPMNLGALRSAGALTGCKSEVTVSGVAVKAVTCDGAPCPGLSIRAGQATFTPASAGSVLVRVLADVDGSDVEDTRTLTVTSGACVPTRIDAGEPSPPPMPDSGRACRIDGPSAVLSVAGIDSLAAANPSLGDPYDGGPETALLFDAPTDGGRGIFSALRASLIAPFVAVGPVAELAGPYSNHEARFTGMAAVPFVFVSDRADAGSQLFAAFADGGVAPMVGAGSDGEAGQPFVVANALWFASNRDGDWEIYRAVRDGAVVGAITHVSELGSPYVDGYPVLSEDELTIFFASDRPSPAGRGMNIWTARRASPALPFTAPVVVPELSTDADEVPGWLSPDGCRLYHTRNDFGTRHLYLDVHLP